jgi:hypothetical protein
MRAFDDPVDPIVYMREKARAIALLKALENWPSRRTCRPIPCSGSVLKGTASSDSVSAAAN